MWLRTFRIPNDKVLMQRMDRTLLRGHARGNANWPCKTLGYRHHVGPGGRIPSLPPSLTLPASYHGVYQVSKMKPWLMNSMTDKSAIVSVLPLHLSTQSYGGVGGRPREDDAHVCRAINLTLPVVKSLSNQH